MYLATVHITLDLEPEVSTNDRERVLRNIRDRLRQTFGQRIMVRTDDESSLWVTWLDDNLTRLQERREDILERVDSAGQARVLNHSEQWFAWFEGRFIETGEFVDDLQTDDEEHRGIGSLDGEFMPTRMSFLTGRNAPGRQEKTIIYEHDDELDGPASLSRTARRQMRLPTRK